MQNLGFMLVAVFLVILLPESAQAFLIQSSATNNFPREALRPCRRHGRFGVQLAAAADVSTVGATDEKGRVAVVDSLLRLVQEDPQEEGTIRDLIHQLSSRQQQINATTTSTTGESSSSSPGGDAVGTALFAPLIGNCNVSCTLPSQPGDRPVGGKWNNKALFAIESTWQHVLPPAAPGSVAQVVNYITLRAFGNLLRLAVVLRGDGYALANNDGERRRIARERQTPGGLSERTVRANFDAPRIAVLKRNGNDDNNNKPRFSFSLGPTSSVILDTPYCDDRVRLGKGSKGSLFVFVRSADPAADGWKEALRVKPVGKAGLLGGVAASLGAAILGLVRWRNNFAARVACTSWAAFSFLVGVLVAFSSGGIERNRREKPETVAIMEQ